jgi:hypothetical protein
MYVPFVSCMTEINIALALQGVIPSEVSANEHLLI